MHTYTMVFMWAIYIICALGAVVWVMGALYALNRWVFTPMSKHMHKRMLRRRALDNAVALVLQDMHRRGV